jgi:hypothetical protein
MLFPVTIKPSKDTRRNQYGYNLETRTYPEILWE